MADNKMFLVNKPTGIAAAIGKRNGYGWHVPYLGEYDEQMTLLFETLMKEGHGYSDDFMIVTEDQKGWVYGADRDDGLVNIRFDEDDEA